MKCLILLVSLAVLAYCQDLKGSIDICRNPPKTPPKSLSDKIALPASYKISGSVTDWRKSSTSLLVESATTDTRVLELQTREQLPSKWIIDLKSRTTSYVNVTGGICKNDAEPPRLIESPRFTSLLGNDTSSLSTIVSGLIRLDKDLDGYLKEEDPEIVGGVETVTWVACINGTNVTSNVLLEVRYSGENTVRPAQAPFSNPLLLSLRMAEFNDFNDTNPVTHVSLEFDRYELPKSTDLAIERGIVCSPQSGKPLPLKKLDEFAGLWTFMNYTTGRNEVVEFYYSKSRNVFIVSGDDMQNGVSILDAPPEKIPQGANYLIHDFGYGYEFALNHDGCLSFLALNETENDVRRTLVTDPISLKPLEDILVDETLRFEKYIDNDEVYESKRDTYRAMFPRSMDDHIVEAVVDKEGMLKSMEHFEFGTRRLLASFSLMPLPLNASRLSARFAQISDCYDADKTKNNTWTMDLKNKKQVDISSVGLDALNDAVADAIAINVAPVIPYRIVTFWVEKPNGDMTLLLRINDRTDVTPANVGYNLTSEISTDELFRKLNETIAADKWAFKVFKADGSSENWGVDAKSVSSYSAEKASSFVGYTGGSMFVLAVFCLLIGAALSAAGVIFVTKRQRISTLAYQVFE